MILWINGAFGSGKSSVAEELSRSISHSHVYDPEQVGYFLWDNFPQEMKRKGNFQHIQIWREVNYKILKYIDDNYDGIIIVPMTIYIRQYYDEIISRLANEGIKVHHFILCATKQTIINRLIHRGETEDCWAVQHIDKCLTAFDTEITEEKIHTEDRSVSDIVLEIISKTSSSLLRAKSWNESNVTKDDT
ncbi:MAG: tunicamycin resistance protein [Bacillota bacterium]